MARMSDALHPLAQLMQTIEDRKANPSATSYTNKLLAGGVPKIGGKITEEAAEVIEAAKSLTFRNVITVNLMLDRQQVTAYMTDSHASNFTSNILVILAEMRAALTVWRPAAFVKGGFV